MASIVPAPPPRKSNRPPGLAVFALGFRPFFLLAGISAFAMMGVWIAVLTGYAPLATYFDPVGWHSHEMLFGYTAAVIGGFLLTAVQNWTGRRSVHGKTLIILTIVWIAARVMIVSPGPFPDWITAVVDLSFLPALGLAIAIPLLKTQQRRNYLFVPLLLALFGANVLVHLQSLQVTQHTARLGIFLALNLVILLIVIMGGRVIPFFTERALPHVKTRSWRWVEMIAVGSIVLLLVAELFAPDSDLVLLLAALAFIANALRLMGWQPWRVAPVPLVWVLHLGYGWIIVGLILKALSFANPELGAVGVHALTLGGIGGLTLGMMARVAIGHTGRQMTVGWDMTLAFGLIHLSAFIRVLFPVIIPGHYLQWVSLSGILWMVAFLLFVIRFTPILLQPRIDGREG
jgi:uncharacterized protein involved in response to NO